MNATKRTLMATLITSICSLSTAWACEELHFKGYESVKCLNDGLVAVSKNNKYGFVDASGKEVIPVKYQEIEFYNSIYHDGIHLIAMKLNKKWAILDKHNNEIIPRQYDAIYMVEDDLLSVNKNGKWGVIDTQNKTIIPFQYDEISIEPSTVMVQKGKKKAY